VTPTLYSPEFYENFAEGAASSAAVVVPLLDELIAPRSVLDVGCGAGIWLAEWQRRGTAIAGIDGAYARDSLVIPDDIFTAADLTTPGWTLEHRFDLVMCLEVAEHLPKRAAKQFIEGLCAHSDIIAFSAAVPNQGGIGHLNERWPSWWTRIFAALGYHPYDLIRERIWWNQQVEWWYRQNLIIFATPSQAQARGFTTPKRSLDLAQPALLIPELQPRIKATVCIPWRPTPSRIAPFARIMDFWPMFGWPIITADSDTEIFSLAQARNNAVRQAKTDIVVISDADTLIDPLNVLRAAADPTGIWWPFDKYRVISPEYLDTPISELINVPHVNTWDGAGIAGVGGAIITSQKEYWRLGGTPPEFCGWGWEDTTFTLIARTLSTVRRLSGCVYAFEHNRDADRYIGARADSPGWDRDITRNKKLFDYYRPGDGRAWLMRELIAQRPEPSHNAHTDKHP
jgi:SAM-dependent methyltransferase